MFDKDNLSVVSYLPMPGFAIWHYITDDMDITDPGYFNDVKDRLSEGNIIIARLDIRGNPETLVYVVQSIDNGHIRIEAMC